MNHLRSLRKHNFKKPWADASEAELLAMDRTDVSGIPSTRYRKPQAASPADALREGAGRKQLPGGDTKYEKSRDEVADNYRMVGEEVPGGVHLSVRREIRM